MKQYLTLRLSIAALCALPAAAQEREQSRGQRIDAVIEAARPELGAPGMSVAVAEAGRIVFRRGYGMADVENAVPAQPATVYRTASLAKPITAAAVLQLVEAKALALDASIRAYVPRLPRAYDRVTVRDLLRHTGGVRHYRTGEFISTRHCDRLTDALEIFGADPLDHQPGEKITYSSYGFTLLGLAIEHVSGLPFADYVRQHVFEPAGMRATRVDDRAIIPNRAAGYTDAGTAGLRNAPLLDSSCRIPAGGFVSTADDMARFAIALDGGVILKPSSARDMMRSQLTPEIIARTLAGMELPPGFEPPGMGYGWAVLPGTGAIYHGGNQPGTTTMLYHLPDRHVSVAIMTNVDGRGDALTELAKTIAAAVDASRVHR